MAYSLLVREPSRTAPDILRTSVRCLFGRQPSKLKNLDKPLGLLQDLVPPDARENGQKVGYGLLLGRSSMLAPHAPGIDLHVRNPDGVSATEPAPCPSNEALSIGSLALRVVQTLHGQEEAAKLHRERLVGRAADVAARAINLRPKMSKVDGKVQEDRFRHHQCHRTEKSRCMPRPQRRLKLLSKLHHWT